ncbi:hypothetical protein GUJ93_ZPchr0008g12716 [Zizania palustris]|uniref:Uncharacterized protein n=1 Tax=Zizania palustris TaxID=103762 RepID=A0A8J5V537_ZIZPA|nr:hypothetical protein GUJ93_ZPchr0008g12716 [Zizania palustris]
MREDQPLFSVAHFLWSEIWNCSVSPKRSFMYPPYIQRVINIVNRLRIVLEVEHCDFTPRVPKASAHAPAQAAPLSSHPSAQSSGQVSSSRSSPSSRELYRIVNES